ncbi:MAG: hypothetical protein IJW51_01030 [Clostridia bacterium]|nr:hypothetical protein [Clostridia bacterium]
MGNNAKPWSFLSKERPDAEAEDTTPTFKYFFKLLWRKAAKLLTLNLMMIFQIIPLIVALLVYFFGSTTPTVEHAVYAPLLGTYIAGGSPAAGTLIGVFGQQLNVPAMTTGRMIVIGIMIAITVLTWGWQNVGATYNLRSLVRGDSTFLWSDYFYAIRRNLKQGFLFGILDLLIIFVLAYDIIYFYPLSVNFGYGLMYGLVVALAVIYLVMRFYIYPMMITFDLSIYKLLKNALLFTMLGIKRNLVAVLGIAVLVVFNVVTIVWGLSIGLSVMLVLPFFYLLVLIGFISMYAAYPNIKRYMIDPYETSDTAHAAPEGEEPDATPQADG